jgi:Na+-driven multidrug efflux pump
MLTQGVAYLLAKLSLPAMTGMILFSMFSLADTWFVARLGPDYLAALTLVIPVQVLITSMASATGVGITSLIGRALGSGQRAYADNSAWHGLGLSIIYGFLLPLLGLAYIDELLCCFGCSKQILLLSKGYMQILLLGSVFTFVPIILCSVIQGEGNTFLPVLVSLVGIISNVILDPIFIFGLGPVKALGLNGAAIAGVLAWYIMQFHPLSIIQYFSQDPALTILGVNCMRLATVFVPLIGPLLILNAVLQGVGRGFTAMFLSLCRQLGFFLPLLVLLPSQLGLNGVWLAFSISELLAAILAFFIFIHLWQGLRSRPGRVPFFTQLGWRYLVWRLYTWLKWR